MSGQNGEDDVKRLIGWVIEESFAEKFRMIKGSQVEILEKWRRLKGGER